MFINDRTKRFGSKILRKAERATGRCLRHNPEKTKHRCSPERRRSNGGSWYRYEVGMLEVPAIP